MFPVEASMEAALILIGVDGVAGVALATRDQRATATYEAVGVRLLIAG